MSYQIIGNLLAETQKYFDSLPDIAAKAASLALNQVAERDGLATMRKQMEGQIVFPNGYLKQADRFGIAQKASPDSLTVVIRARDRATSLARFAPAQTPENSRRRPINLQVKPGVGKRLSKAFLVRLRNGNIGLATRDEKLIKRAHKPVELGEGVFLLYAPSVDQVFKSVADDALPKISEQLSKEFFRQFLRLST